METTDSNWIAVARIMRAHGVRGELKAQPLTHDIHRYRFLKRVRLESPRGSMEDMELESCTLRGSFWLMKFRGLNSPEEALRFHNSLVLIPSQERLPAPPGQYYESDLVGLKILDMDGRECGHVKALLFMPSVDTLVLRIHGYDVYAPWIDDCIVSVNPERGFIQVNLEYLADIIPQSGKKSEN